MQGDRITNGAGAAITALVITTNGYSVMLGSGAGRDSWIAHLLACLVALVCAWCFTNVCDKYPDKTFFEALTAVFGKVVGKLFAIVLAVFSLGTCVVSLTVFSRFVQITALPRTPQIIIPLLIIVIAALSLRRGLRAAAGSARLLIWFCIAVFIAFAVFGIKWMDFSYILPVLEKPQTVLLGAGEVFLNRFGAIPALMAVYTRMDKERGRRKLFIGSVAGASVALTAVSLVTVATLGTETVARDFYPVFTAMSVRGIGGFIQHTEILACITMTLCLFFKSAVCLLFSDDMLSGISGTHGREGAAVPMALICAAATQIIYRDISSLRGMVEWKSGAGAVAAVYILLPIMFVLIFQLRRKTQ